MRTIVAFFWFCTLVITAAYTANLAAFLTLQQIDNRIKSVDHLARQTVTKYGVLNNSDLMHFFENSRFVDLCMFVILKLCAVMPCRCFFLAFFRGASLRFCFVTIAFQG